MITRTLPRWLMSVVFATLSLVTINLLVATSPVQSRPAASHINCSGSIQACIDAANDGDTILIAAGIYTESLTLSKPVSLTGENRDTTIIHAMAGQRVLTVTGATVSNSVVISGLTFTGGSADYGGGLYSDVPMVVINSHFISNTALQAGGGIYSAGSVTLSRTNVIGNSSGWGGGGGIFLDREANLTLADVTVIGNTTERLDGGGGVQIQSGAVTVTNSRFENNRCNCFGGGLQMTGGHTKTLTISQTVFVGNEAASGGGLFSIYALATIVDSQFISNTAHTYSGGGFNSNQGSIDLIGSQFLSNTAQLEGGGLFAYPYFPDAAVRMTGTHFLYNRAIDTSTSYGFGGGAAVMGTAIISDGLFEGNVAHGQQGGGLSATYLVATGTTFIRNSIASSFGHGGGASAAVATIVGSRFEENMTGGSGGGFSSQWATISDARFISNTASGFGGGFYQYGDGRSSIVNTLFARNTAGSAGGAAIATTSAGSLDVTQATIADTVVNPRSAMAVFSGTIGVSNTIIANHTFGIRNVNGTVTEDYNLYFNTVTNTIGVITGSHGLIGDPKFVDPFNGHYHLQLGSAAIDRGVDAGVYTDLDGNVRPHGAGFDIGAYEYQGGIYYLWLPLIRK